MSEISDEAVTAAAEAIEDEAIRRIGRDLGTTHRDDIVRAGLAAALPYLLEQDRTEKMIDLEYRAFDAESALAELVRLKDGARDEAYERDKPLAWGRARAVLEQLTNKVDAPVLPKE